MKLDQQANHDGKRIPPLHAKYGRTGQEHKEKYTRHCGIGVTPTTRANVEEETNAYFLSGLLLDPVFMSRTVSGVCFVSACVSLGEVGDCTEVVSICVLRSFCVVMDVLVRWSIC